MASIKESALRLVLKARDSLSKPVQQSSRSLEALRSKSVELKRQLSDLEQQDQLLSSFQQQKKAVLEAGQAYREAEQKVQRLAKEYSQTEKPSRQMQRSLDSARKSVIAANQAYQKQRSKLTELRGSLDKTGLSNRQIADQQNRIQRELKQTSTAFEKVSDKARKASSTLKRNAFKQLGKDASTASKGISRLTGRITALVTAGAGLYALKRGMQSVLQTGDQFERLEVQMKAIMGSMAEGERAIAWIKEFTKNTPLELQQVAESFTALKNFGLDPMDGTLQAIVDQTAKLGGGMERLNGMTLALGQAWAKQKLQGEEILQLVERGVPVWELLEKVTGKNTQELQKLSSAGKLGRDTIKLLIEEIGKSSAGAAAENMSLLSGLMANMSDRWTEFKDSVADAGWQNYVKGMLTDLGIQLDALAKNGSLNRLAKSISDGFISMVESVRASLAGLTVDDFVAGIKSGFETVSTTLGNIRNAFTITGQTIRAFFNGLALVANGFAEAITYTMAQLAGGTASLLNALGADDWAQRTELIAAALRDTSAAYKENVEQDIKDINDAFKKIGERITSSTQQTQERVRQYNKKTIDELLGNYPKVEQAAKATGDKVQSAFKDAADALKQINAAETRTELADLGVALAAAFANGTLSQQEYSEALEASKQKLKELKEAAEGAAGAAGSVGDAMAEGASAAQSSGGGLAGFYNNITSELYGLSAQAEDTFLAMRGATDIDTTDTLGELGQLKVSLEEVKGEADELANTGGNFDVTGIGQWMNKTAASAAHVKAEFYEQKVALEELVQGYEDGSVSAEQLASQGRATADSMDLLNQQDLDRLNSSIEQAESSMERLNDSTRSTMENLQDELDRLQGRQENIEQRRFDERGRDLQQQLDQAQQEDDNESVSNLQKALSLNQEIFSEKRKQLQQQKQEETQRKIENNRRQENSRINSERQRPQDVPTARRASSEKVIRLEYPGGSVNVGVSRGDEAKLLEALKNAGMRSV